MLLSVIKINNNELYLSVNCILALANWGQLEIKSNHTPHLSKAQATLVGGEHSHHCSLYKVNVHLYVKLKLMFSQ